MGTTATTSRLPERILDALQTRAAWDPSRAAFTFGRIADIVFSRYPGDGRPTKAEIKAAVKQLGGRVRVHDGKVSARM